MHNGIFHKLKFENPLGKNRIDLAVRDGKTIYFYEAKTANSAKACIRESLGQIMEYAYYPNKSNATKLLIDGDHKPSNEINEYITRLNGEFNIPIHYLQIKI